MDGDLVNQAYQDKEREYEEKKKEVTSKLTEVEEYLARMGKLGFYKTPVYSKYVKMAIEFIKEAKG